jgi:hypothetical protein
MKRTYISPEFKYNLVNGSFKMAEDVSFFSSKMLKIDELLSITNDNLVYYQLPNGEQLDEESEKSFSEILFDATVQKKNNHSIIIDADQSEQSKNEKAKWVLSIDLKTILIDYIFAKMKFYRTFNGLRNSMTRNNDVNSAIVDYIKLNVLSRYKLLEVEFFLDYVNLTEEGKLKYANEYDPNIQNIDNKVRNFTQEINFDNSQLRLLFNQQELASKYSFKYYFNLYYERI